MTSRSFRRLFPQLNVQSVPEDEFYRQASLSQLLTGPDEQELTSFRPDVKDPLELVEATPELAGMLGSSLEFVDTRWDSLEASPPPTPSPPPSPRPPQRIPSLLPPQQQGMVETGAKLVAALQNRSAESGQSQGLRNVDYSTPAAKMDTKLLASMWEQQKQGGKTSGAPVPTKPNVTMNVIMWEPQRQKSKNVGIPNSASPDSKLDSGLWQIQRQQSLNIGVVNSANPDSQIGSSTSEQQIKSIANPDTKIDSGLWEQGPKSTTDALVKSDVEVCEPQRLRSRNAANSDAKMTAGVTSSPADANAFKQNQGSKNAGVSDPANPGSVDASVWESQRLRSKNAGTPDPAKPNATPDDTKWERQGVKRAGATSPTPKREASICDPDQIVKTIKLDAAWQRNLGNVRVHIRDLGLKVGGGVIQRDVKKEQGKDAGKGARVKTRS